MGAEEGRPKWLPDDDPPEPEPEPSPEKPPGLLERMAGTRKKKKTSTRKKKTPSK